MDTKHKPEEFTYDSNFQAFLGDEIVTVPDQIADEQCYHDSAQTIFPARCRRDRRIMVRLDGDAYGLRETGTGDMIVRKSGRHAIR